MFLVDRIHLVTCPDTQDNRGIQELRPLAKDIQEVLRPLVRDIQVHRLQTRGIQGVPRPRGKDTLEEPRPQTKDTPVLPLDKDIQERDPLQVAAMVAPRPLARGTAEVLHLLDSTAATQRPLGSSTAGAGAGATLRGRGAGWTPRCSSGSARWTRTGAAR